MYQISLKSIKSAVTILWVLLLASCSCSNNAPLRDLIIPKVTSTTPSNGSTNAVINTFINVTFSEKMKASSITESTFKLVDNQGKPVAGTVTTSGTSATFKPNQSLNKNTLYTAILSRQVKDLSNNQIIADYRWAFTTGTETDITTPSVENTYPVEYSIDVPLDTYIEVSLDQVISPSSVTATSFRG